MKSKLSLKELKVSSFITSNNGNTIETARRDALKGGIRSVFTDNADCLATRATCDWIASECNATC